MALHLVSNDSDTPRSCTTGCGFFGRLEIFGLCEKCYRINCMKLLFPYPPPTNASAETVTKERERCGCCNKRLGFLNGQFKCPCGNTYCSKHRHPEDHQCAYDFKAAGRDLLAKNNPVLKADKLYIF